MKPLSVPGSEQSSQFPADPDVVVQALFLVTPVIDPQCRRRTWVQQSRLPLYFDHEGEVHGKQSHGESEYQSARLLLQGQILCPKALCL